MAAGTRKHGSGAGRGPGSLWFTDSGLGRWAYRGVSGRKSRSGARVRSWGLTPGAEEHLAAASALLPVLSSASDQRGRDPKTAGGQAGRQVGASVQPAREGRFGAREEPALNSQVLTGTLRRHHHPQGGPHLGLPTTQGHLSFPRASACLWGLVPSPFRSLSLSD